MCFVRVTQISTAKKCQNREHIERAPQRKKNEFKVTNCVRDVRHSLPLVPHLHCECQLARENAQINRTKQIEINENDYGTGAGNVIH